VLMRVKSGDATRFVAIPIAGRPGSGSTAQAGGGAPRERLRPLGRSLVTAATE
jgi:hypothetical protein